MRHPFYFTTLPNYDSRLKPSGSSRWSQRFSQALGFARLDSVSLLFASYLGDFSSLQYRYVCGWNMRYNVFTYSWIQSPIFTSIAQQIHRPLCVHHDLLLAAGICLHLSERLAGIMKRSVVVIWFLWGQTWIVAFPCWTFLFVLIIIFKYCDWRRADVGPTSAGDINPTSKRRWADIARPISTQRRPNTCSVVVFFSLHNLPELLCAEIVPMLEAANNSGPVLAWLQTYCTLTWKLDSY